MKVTIKNTDTTPQNWYFTFGSGQRYEDCFAVFQGTFDVARSQMFTAFGPKWAFQYSEAQWNEDGKSQQERFHLTQLTPIVATITGYKKLEYHPALGQHFVLDLDNGTQLDSYEEFFLAIKYEGHVDGTIGKRITYDATGPMIQILALKKTNI